MRWMLPNSEIYHSERWGNAESIKYSLPAPTKDGVYTLVMKFSEIYWGEPGQKIFDVKIGKKTVIADLDIFGKIYARGLPYDEFIEI